MNNKYTDQQIIEAVKISFSVQQVLEKIGSSKTSGASHQLISKRIKKLNLDTSHFKKAGYFANDHRKFKAEDILVYDRRNGIRERTYLLNNALLEINRKYECEECGLNNIWNDKILKLEIDHIDNNPINNISSNLRYLCPNCHSQK